MKKGKYTLIIMAIIIIVLLIIWWITLNNKQESDENINNVNNSDELINNSSNEQVVENIEQGSESEEIIDPPVRDNYNIELVTDRNMFYSVEQNVSTYLKSVTDRNAGEIYKFLDDDYIQKFGVTEQNVLEHVEDYSTPVRFSAQEIYQMINLDTQITTYYVRGFIEKQVFGDYGNTDDYCVTLNYDAFNRTFSIMPLKYMFANTISYQEENEKIKVTMKQYVAYMDRVEVTMTIQNKTANQIDVSNNAKLSFYEDKSYSDVTVKNNEIIETGASRDVTLTFSNNIKTPKDVIILGLQIPVIHNQTTKN